MQSGKHDFEQVESKLKNIITTINRESKVLILLGKLDKTDNELQLNQKDIDTLFNHYPYILGIEKILKLHKTICCLLQELLYHLQNELRM